MLDNKLLNKVYEQIVSETRINNDKLHTPFLDFLLSWPIRPDSISYFHNPSPSYSFSRHCKEVYSLKNDQEIEYVWEKYKKELIHKDKRMMV